MSAPYDDGTTPTLAQLIREGIDSRLVDVHTALPGRVERYDASKQVADVLPMVKRVIRKRDGTAVGESLPVIPSVPVLWPRAGGFFLHLPMEVGDTVLLVFPERSIDRWRQSGSESDPADQRLHPLTGAVAIPGLFPTSSAMSSSDASASEARIGQEGGPQIAVSGTQVKLGSSSASQAFVKGNQQQSALDTFLTAFQVWATAVEAGVSAGGGVVAPPAPVNFTAAITQLKTDLQNALSTKVKGE